jgi:hypothetical protein
VETITAIARALATGFCASRSQNEKAIEAKVTNPQARTATGFCISKRSPVATALLVERFFMQSPTSK